MAVSNNPRVPAFNAQVIQAQRTKKFSDGSPIKLGSTDYEQAFIVDANKIIQVPVKERGKYTCKIGRESVSGPYTHLDLKQFANLAGGHTHPQGRRSKNEPYPGPGDHRIAEFMARYNNPSYVIASTGAYIITFEDDLYDIKVLSGSSLRSRVKRDIIRRWNKGGVSKGNRTCNFRSINPPEGFL